ncbi:MAG: hypothetical protein ACC656_07060, partial [Candidatus Heimdallarchaeota archaeon]
KVPNEVIQQLTAEEVSEISYLLDNAFVQDLNSRRYSFDPILGGWLDGKTYYVEWEGQFFRLDKTENDTDVIIGDYLYKVNSTVNIEYDVPEEIIDPDLQAQYRKVLINEISTLKNQIVIVDRLVFENTIGNNVIQHTNTTYTTLDRNYALYLDKGRLKWGFTITLDAELNNNVFSISNYEEADLYWIQMNDRKFAIKQYPLNIPNIGGLYYIHADDAIRVNNISEEIWINNGINTKDENYYNYNDVQNVPDDKYPLFYKIFRASFSDIKDFDFDRVETQYSDYEYRLESSVVETSEPKLYARDRRNIHIAIQKPVELTDSNFTNEQLREYLFSEPVTYTEWLQQYENTISKNGDEQFFERYEFYVDFKWNNIVNEEAFSIGNQSYNDASDSNSVSLTVGTYQALLPLYVNPTRIPILDSNGEQFLDPLTNEPLWQRDWVGDYVFTTNSAPTTELIDLDREWYREEGYILLQQDEPNEETISLDFKSTSEPLAIKIKYPWDDPANNDPRTTLYPMAYEFKWSPFSKSSKDPNEVIDTNY